MHDDTGPGGGAASDLPASGSAGMVYAERVPSHLEAHFARVAIVQFDKGREIIAATSVAVHRSLLRTLGLPALCRDVAKTDCDQILIVGPAGMLWSYVREQWQ